MKLSQTIKTRLLVVLGVLIACVYFAFPLQKKINLGLDLKGGMHLVLNVETDKLTDPQAKADAVPRAIEILRNRIDGLGVAEPVIQRQGENQIIIQLPGITDRDAALRMIGEVAELEFKIVNDDLNQLKEALNGNVPPGYQLKYTKDNHEPLLLEDRAALKGDAIADARVDYQTQGFGEPIISLTFNSEGAKKFANLTRQHVEERLAIILDGEVLSAPRINEPILSGRGVITGQFSFEEASLLALALRSGSLPAPMHIEEERTIGPLLGKDSIDAGITATIVGGIAVLAFMSVYYLIPGVVSCVALGMNLVLILGIMAFLNAMMPEAQVTLTLPGIAGIILTLGMAVDANVLINERVREELKNGRPLRAAVTNGFSKAYKAIIDANTTTLIAAFMLFQFGSGPIKGFAVTLSMGLIASLFTSLFVTRTLLMTLIELNIVKSLPMLQMFGDTKINFLSKRYLCFILSGTLFVMGMFTLYKKGDSAYGIDFAGGQIQEYRFEQPIKPENLRKALTESNVSDDAVIQTFKEHPNTFIVRTAADTYDAVTKSFKEKFPGNSYKVLRIEKVGPVVGKALRRAAILAMIFALAGILVYVGIRFKHLDFAAAGVIALLHDVTVTLGILVMLNRQVDLLVVTALLTIAGYSINDTIIIYDRVRENMANTRVRKQPLADILNSSINQTLGRTVLTTLTTLLVVVALYQLGGEVLNTFALTLLIGFITGTYSTIFIASPLVLAWPKKKHK